MTFARSMIQSTCRQASNSNTSSKQTADYKKEIQKSMPLGVTTGASSRDSLQIDYNLNSSCCTVHFKLGSFGSS